MQTNDEDERRVLHEIETLLQKIQHRGYDRLLPFAPKIIQLSQNLQQLAYTLDSPSDREASTAAMNSLTRIASKDPPVHPPVQQQSILANDVVLTRQKSSSTEQQVAHTLQCASRVMQKLHDSIIKLNHHHLTTLRQDPRASHIHHILHMQDKEPLEVHGQDRILLVLACLSLARDFRTFERQSGWTPKQDQLIRPLLSGREPSTQRIGNHVHNFASALSIMDHDKLSAGLRFGIKLQVIRELFNATTSGEGIALLLGFECRAISRLSYKRLLRLKEHCENGHEFENIRSFCSSISDWLRKAQLHYDRSFGKYASNNDDKHGISSTGTQLSFPSPFWDDYRLEGSIQNPMQQSSASDYISQGIPSIQPAVPGTAAEDFPWALTDPTTGPSQDMAKLHTEVFHLSPSGRFFLPFNHETPMIGCTSSSLTLEETSTMENVRAEERIEFTEPSQEQPITPLSFDGGSDYLTWDMVME